MTKTRMRGSTYKMLFLLACIFFIPRNIFGGGIAPQFSTFVFKPGESRQITITVLQDRDKSSEVSLVPSHCHIDRDGRLVFSENFSDLGLKADPKGYSAVSFIKPEKVTLKYDEWKEVPITVSVPESTRPGEYYAAIVAKPTNLVSVVSIMVEPESLRTDARIATVETAFINDQLLIRALLENTGSRTIVPSAVALIKRKGKLIDAVALEVAGKQNDFVMHNNTRKLIGKVQNVLPVYDKYDAEIIVSYGPTHKLTVSRQFSVDRDTYLRQRDNSVIEVNPSFVKLAIPPGGFYVCPLWVRNPGPDPVTIRVFATEVWSLPTVTEETLQPEETKAVNIALFTPKSFDKLETKVIIMPNKGKSYQSSIKVYPKTRFED
jgi:hypothetical protein